MAIGRMIRPAVLVDGVVERVAERKSKKSGEVFAHEVTLKQHSDAVMTYTVYTRSREEYGLPAVGEFAAVECSVEESREWGTSLNFERPAFDALDRIQSALSAA